MKIFCCNNECGKKSTVAVSVPRVDAIILSTTTEKNIRQDGGAKVSYDIYVIFTIHGKKDRETRCTKSRFWQLRKNGQVEKWVLMSVEQNPEKFSEIFRM
jgi:hypothetical protein